MAGELILIIEDNKKNLKLVRDVLQFRGYQTAEATCAKEGLRLASAQQPALILMDIQLPEMDGITALKNLRSNPVTTKIPIVALTALAMEHDRQKIMAAGFDGYHTKPINLGELTAMIRQTLDRRVSLIEEGRKREDNESKSKDLSG